MKMSGIYRLDFSSGHFYIGQAANVIKRWRTHRSAFRRDEMAGKHPKLGRIWAKYGEPTLIVLAYCETDELTRIEQHLITTYWNNPLFANTNPDAKTSRGVKRTHVAWQKGKKFTAEHRERLSLAKQDVGGVKNNNSKLTEVQVREIRETYKWQAKGKGSTTLAKEYGVSYRTILYVVNGERYANVKGVL